MLYEPLFGCIKNIQLFLSAYECVSYEVLKIKREATGRQKNKQNMESEFYETYKTFSRKEKREQNKIFQQKLFLNQL